MRKKQPAGIMAIIIGVMQGEFFSVIDWGKACLVEHMKNAFVITDKSYGYQGVMGMTGEMKMTCRRFQELTVQQG